VIKRVNLVYPWDYPALGPANKIYQSPTGKYYLVPAPPKWAVRGFILVCLLLLIAFSLGCSSCPPCSPEHTVVDNQLPIYYCPSPPELPPLVLPPWPVLPDNPTSEEIKTWYIDMATTVKAWISILSDRSETLDGMLDAYRKAPNP
jgi:hypothetical protein